MSKITDFVIAANADKDKKEHLEFELGIVGNTQGQRIASETGVHSLSGAKKILTADGARHAFVNHAGKKSESERGQIGITHMDFNFLADILSNPISVERGDLNHRKSQDIIKFSKNIKGRIYNVLMSISRSKEGTKLFFNTMFIKK
jgi:hypothetical protein